MENLLSSFFVSFFVSFLASFFFLLATLKNYSENIDDYKLKEEQAETNEEKGKIEQYRFKYERKSVRNYIIKTISICVIISSFSFFILMNYVINSINNGIIEVYKLKLDFIYSWWFISIMAISFILFLVVIISVISDEEKYKVHILFSSLTIFLFFFWFSSYLLDSNFSEEFLQEPQIIHLTSPIVSGEFTISWTEVEHAARYIVSVNGEKRFFGTSQTSYKLEDLEYMKSNLITITAIKYGSKPRESRAYEIYYLPPINKVSINSGDIGHEISAQLTCNNVSEEDMHIIYENVEYSWMRDGKSIDNKSDNMYILTAEDYGKKIAVSVRLGEKTIVSNKIEPGIGSFTLPKLSYYIQGDFVCMRWNEVEGAEWYDCYIDDRTIATTKLNYVFLHKESVLNSQRFILGIRGLGYNDAKTEEHQIYK